MCKLKSTRSRYPVWRHARYVLKLDALHHLKVEVLELALVTSVVVTIFMLPLQTVGSGIALFSDFLIGFLLATKLSCKLVRFIGATITDPIEARPPGRS